MCRSQRRTLLSSSVNDNPSFRRSPVLLSLSPLENPRCSPLAHLHSKFLPKVSPITFFVSQTRFPSSSQRVLPPNSFCFNGCISDSTVALGCISDSTVAFGFRIPNLDRWFTILIAGAQFRFHPPALFGLTLHNPTTVFPSSPS